jgi:hypothetical protein
MYSVECDTIYENTVKKYGIKKEKTTKTTISISQEN